MRGILWIHAALAVSLIAVPAAAQTAISGDFYYSTYGSDNEVGEGTFDWTGTTLTATTQTLVSLPGNAIDGSLAIGNDGMIYTGRAGSLYEVNPSNGTFTSSSTGVNNNTTSVDPTGSTIWVGWKDTSLAYHAVGTPISSWNTRPVNGSETVATGLAWVPNGLGGYTTWYTTGGETGLGNVGTINLSTGATTRYLTGVSATAITFDPYSDSLFTAGYNGIDQINPNTGLVESTWLNPLGMGLDITQIAATGSGQILAFNNNGNLLIWDLTSGGGLIANAATGSFDTGVLSAGIDLIPVPEPPAWLMLLLGTAGALPLSRRGRWRPLHVQTRSFESSQQLAYSAAAGPSPASPAASRPRI